MLVLKQYKGVPVYVLEDGGFEAIAGTPPKKIRRRDLKRLEAEIDRALPVQSSWPGQRIFQLSDWPGSEPASGFVRSYRIEKRKWGDSIKALDESGREIHIHRNTYRFDQEVVDALSVIQRRIAELTRERDVILARASRISAYDVKTALDRWNAEHAGLPAEVKT